jgi:transmembrane sensor
MKAPDQTEAQGVVRAIVPEFEEPDFDMLEAAAHWVERLAVPHDVAERAKFDAWLAERPAHEFAWAEMRVLREAITPAAIESAARYRKPERTWRSLRLATALVAGAAAIVVGCFMLPEVALLASSDAHTARGETRDLRLPDGSRVLLNSGSAVALNFDGRRRGVHLLRGEAYFDIARDPARPFTVATGDADVRVLGTHFNVRLDGARTTVTVAQGRVQFGARGDRQGQLLLTDGQQAFSENGASQRQPIYEPGAASAWRQGQMVFYRTPFREVIAEIQRYRPGTIFLANSALGHRTVSGAFSTRSPDVALANSVHILGAQLLKLPGGIVIVYE